MNTRPLTISLITLALTVSTAALADEIYKWTDADGNVHYEDRPSGDPSEERLQFSYNRTDKTAVQSRVQTRRDYENARRESREESQAAERTAAEERVAAEKKAARCTEYRGKMKTMLESRKLYREDANGERVYLDDTAREEARKKAEELIKETCNS